MRIIIFIPGYLTSQTCLHNGDQYIDVARYIGRHNSAEFIYVPIPNNNYGDLGNTTIDHSLDHVIRMYNQACARFPDASITLVPWEACLSHRW